MSTVYMQLQNTRQNSVITQYSNILFPDVIARSDNSLIDFDPASGIITINQIGAYYLDWYIVSEQAEIPILMLMQITSEGGRYVPANSGQTRDQVTGSSVVNVDEPGTQIVISNVGSNIVLADVPVAANLVIHSIEVSNVIIPPDPDDVCGGGSIINFQNGVVDCPICNPFSWPILLECLQFSWWSDHFDDMKKTFTPSGLETYLGMPAGALSASAVSTQVNNALASVNNALLDVIDIFGFFSNFTSDAGLISTDVYLSHADASVVPAIATGDLPFISLDGAITPQIIAEDGIITSFAAEYDCLAAIDVSLLNVIPGTLATINQLIDVFVGTIATLISTLATMGTLLLGLGTPLPSNFADMLNKWIMEHLKANTMNSNHHVHAILWKRSDVSDMEINWEKVSDVDLGPVPFAELAPLDTFLSSIGDIIAAGGNVISTILSLLGGRGTINQSPTNVPFRSGLDKNVHHPIKAGDYLVVQFTLVGGDNTTVCAGVIAPNIMASVAIDRA